MMGTDYSRLMEGMMDTLEARVRELEAERDAAFAKVGRLKRDLQTAYAALKGAGDALQDKDETALRRWLLTNNAATKAYNAWAELEARADTAEAENAAMRLDPKALENLDAVLSLASRFLTEGHAVRIEAARAEKAESERDAALAKVERLREWLEYINSDTYGDRHLNDSADALEGKPAPSPVPEPWPCGHDKVRHDDVCRECSP